jgi:hypothetical protein
MLFTELQMILHSFSQKLYTSHHVQISLRTTPSMWLILQWPVSLWTVVLLHHITHILTQNSCCWMLCNPANIGIAAGNTAERSCTAFLLTMTISSTDWNWLPSSFLSSKERKKKLHGVRSGEYGGCVETVTCCFAGSSWTSRKWCAGALSCRSSHFFLCQSSGRLQQIESLRWRRISL